MARKKVITVNHISANRAHVFRFVLDLIEPVDPARFTEALRAKLLPLPAAKALTIERSKYQVSEYKVLYLVQDNASNNLDDETIMRAINELEIQIRDMVRERELLSVLSTKEELNDFFESQPSY